MLPAWINGALRTALQAGWAWLATYAAAKLGVHLPAREPAWVDAAAYAGVLTAVTAAIQWAERRSGSTLVGRVLRRLARVATLNLRPAIYPNHRAAVPPAV